MATQASLDLVQTLYVAYYGRPADAAGQTYWADRVDSEGASAIINAFGTSEEYDARFGELSDEELVNNLYQQLFGRDAEQAGIDYYAGELEAGNSTLAEIALEIRNGAQNEDADAVAAKLEAAQEFTDLAGDDYAGDEAADVAGEFLSGVDADTDVDALDVQGAVDGLPEAEEPTEPSVPGEEFDLTVGSDSKTGTENDDTFYGFVGQNDNGSIANALSTGDRINGGEGRDKIEASVMEDQEVESGTDSYIAPRTKNVEEVYLEAQDLQNTDTVRVDAGQMNSVEQYWSDDSSANLFLNDVRLGDKLSVTKDVTFGMRDVDTSAGLSAAFDTNSLTNEGTFQTNSQLLVRVADVTTETPAEPLANVELTIGFTVGGEQFSLENVRSTDGTYAGMQEAIQAELGEQGLGDYNVELANPYNQVTVGPNTVNLPFTAQEILVTDPAGNDFTNVSFDYNSVESVDEEFLVAGTAQPVEPDLNTTLIETNLVLDNAGRGSTAGDAIIGGMSNSEQAIQKLNLVVDESSKVDDVMSAVGMDAAEVTRREAFEQIEVTSGEDQGDLSIANVGNVYNFDATAFEGENLSVSGQAGFTNFGADASENAENLAHVYNTADSDDSVSVQWNGDKAGEFANFTLDVNTAGGDDNVHLTSQFMSELNRDDQADLQNVSVNAGAGDDVVWTEGAGAVNVEAKSGNDVVYTDNSGSQWMSGDNGAATWLVGTDNNLISDLNGTNGVALAAATEQNTQGEAIPAVLLGAELQVTFSGANIGGELTGADSTAFDNGFESTVKIFENDDQIFGDRTDVNDAIKRAINDDETLSNLLQVSDGPNNSLVIRSLVDGSFVADDLEIEVLNAQITDEDGDRYLGESDQQRIIDAIQEETSDSEYDEAAFGNDVLVESADAANGIEGVGVDAAKQATAAGVAETFDVTFDAGSTANDTLAFDGVTVTLGANADAAALADDFAAKYNADAAASWVATEDSGTITFESKAVGDRTDVVNGDFAFTDADSSGNPASATVANIVDGTGGDLTGTASTADNSGNIVDLGSDDDLVVLSTNVASNETLKFTDFANGENTIVNFNSDAASAADFDAEGVDQFDFSEYLTTLDATRSDSTESQTLVAADAEVGTDMAANQVTAFDFAEDAVNNETFAGLEAGDLVAALNGDDDFGNLGNLDMGTIADDTFVGDSYSAVLMVENDQNDGEYKVFQVNVDQDADNANAGVASSASLIGTYDFGETLTGLTDASLAS